VLTNDKDIDRAVEILATALMKSSSRGSCRRHLKINPKINPAADVPGADQGHASEVPFSIARKNGEEYCEEDRGRIWRPNRGH
jgi:hypothetical protein